MGIATQLRTAIIAHDGISKEEATKLFWLVDKHGLLIDRDGKGASFDDAQTVGGVVHMSSSRCRAVMKRSRGRRIIKAAVSAVSTF